MISKIYLFGIPLIKIETKTIKKEKKENKLFQSFIYHDIASKTILMIEANDYHGECLTGMAKYFLDMGYNVDVIMTPDGAALAPFGNFQDARINIFQLYREDIQRIMSSDIIEKYSHVYINSDRITNRSYYELYKQDLKFPVGKFIVMCHSLENFHFNNFEDPRFCGITLANLPPVKDLNCRVVNSHYFGDFAKHTKGDITRFICVGNIESKRKNHSYLIDAVDSLLSRGITNFKVSVVARIGTLDIPKHIKPYIDFKGRLSYPDMFREISNSDFFLTLLDPENEAHNRYITGGTSGSFQLMHGFNIPLVIPQYFATDFYGLNKSNCICYDHQSQSLADVMADAIAMDADKYSQIKSELKQLSASIEKSSLENLRDIMETAPCPYPTNTFISLGENCFTRTVLTRHNVKATKEQGELSMPFDLCVNSIRNTSKLIQNDFAGYFDNLEFDHDKNIYVNNSHCTLYTHDVDCSPQNPEKIITRYANRIANFRNIIDTQDAIFVATSVNPAINVDDINSLYQELKAKYQHHKFKLIFINIAREEITDASKLNKDIVHAHIPHPYPNYWGAHTRLAVTRAHPRPACSAH